MRAWPTAAAACAAAYAADPPGGRVPVGVDPSDASRHSAAATARACPPPTSGGPDQRLLVVAGRVQVGELVGEAGVGPPGTDRLEL
jgi:hypothetical protein